MQDCIFCAIASGKSDVKLLAKSEHFVAILDRNPVTPGHALIIPHVHTKTLEEFPAELMRELMEFSKKVGTACVRATASDGFNFVINVGEAAGQSVFHTHAHIVPRKKDDGIIAFPMHLQMTEEEFSAIRENIRQHV